ncbi:MAG: hypothetical protein ABJO67_10965 [Pseudoruegeria sp.]
MYPNPLIQSHTVRVDIYLASAIYRAPEQGQLPLDGSPGQHASKSHQETEGLLYDHQ